MHDDYWFELILWAISAIAFFCLFDLLVEMI